jgi:hypothetical protein
MHGSDYPGAGPQVYPEASLTICNFAADEALRVCSCQYLRHVHSAIDVPGTTAHRIALRIHGNSQRLGPKLGYISKVIVDSMSCVRLYRLSPALSE